MRRNSSIGAILLSLGAALLAVAPCLADGGQHDAQKGELEIPKTTEGIWHAIGEQEEHLVKIIEQGELSLVHKAAFAIRDLAEALPKTSEDLSAAKHKQLGGYVTRIADHAENLDNYGDSGQQGKTEAELEKLKKRLSHMRKLYPDSMFAHGGDEHASADKHAGADGHNGH